LPKKVVQNRHRLWQGGQNASVTVFAFFDELQVTSGNGLINVGEFEATSAHWLALLVFTSTSDAWHSCRKISDRSHQNDRYEYAARAIDLLSEVWLPKLPSPQRIYERLRVEFILAKAKLKQMAHGGQRSSNNQSERWPHLPIAQLTMGAENTS